MFFFSVPRGRKRRISLHWTRSMGVIFFANEQIQNISQRKGVSKKPEVCHLLSDIYFFDRLYFQSKSENIWLKPSPIVSN